MPFVRISVPEGALTQSQKQELVAKMTDVVVEVEGIEQIRPSVHVLVEEVADGGWGVGGKAWTVEALREAFGAKAQDKATA